MYHAGRKGFSTVVISCDNTDIFMLALAFKSFIASSVYIKCRAQARTRYIDITHDVQHHGSEVCRCLPGLHAFTACETVSAFSRKGRMSALRLTKWQVRLRELLQLKGTDRGVSDELFSRLQEFTYFMYSSNSGMKDVNDLQYCLFYTKKGELDSNQLPPCFDTLPKSQLPGCDLVQESPEPPTHTASIDYADNNSRPLPNQYSILLEKNN